MIEIVAVMLMIILLYGGHVWRGEAKWQKIRANAAEAKLGLCKMELEDLERKNNNQGNTINCLMATCDRHNISQKERWRKENV